MRQRGRVLRSLDPFAISERGQSADTYCSSMKLKIKTTTPQVAEAAPKKHPPGTSLSKVITTGNISRPKKGEKPYTMGRSEGGLINTLVCVGHDYTYRVRLVDNELFVESLSNPLTIHEKVEIKKTMSIQLDPHTIKVTDWKGTK